MNRQAWIAFGITLAMIAGTGGLLGHVKSRQRLGPPGVKLVAQPLRDERGRVLAPQTIALPPEVLGAESKPLPVEEMTLTTLPKDTTYGRRLYHWPDGFDLLVNAVLMGADRTSIHKPETCLEGQGWQIDPSRAEVVAIPIEGWEPGPLAVMKLACTKRGQAEGRAVVRRGIYVYWFVAAGQTTPRHRERMWSMAKHLLSTGELQRWAYISCFAVCAPGQEGITFERMKQFIAAAAPQVQAPAKP